MAGWIMTLVRIDLSTLKRNPDAGQCVFLKQITAEQRIKQVITPLGSNSWRKDMFWLNGDDWVWIPEKSFTQTGNLPASWIDKEWRIPRRFGFVNSVPSVSKWSFAYEQMLVCCRVCGHVMMLDDLMYDEIGGGYDYNNEVCPRCEAWGCVRLTYETVEQALERQKQIAE